MQHRFEGKSIIGGSGGIRSAISQRLAEEDTVVIIGDIKLHAPE